MMSSISMFRLVTLNKSIAVQTFICVAISACGTSESGTATPQEVAPALAQAAGELAFRGYVGGAFPIAVDGAPYEDSEDFYTQELARLPAKLQAAGYDKSWNWSLDAVVGFQDLSINMMVYISPNAKNGYLAKSPVDSAGAFEMSLPMNAQDDSYMVRAVKRINLVLEKSGEVKRICYNFSAIDKNVPASESAKPIVLSTFSTKITAYACTQETGKSGLIITPNEAANEEDSEDALATGKDSGSKVHSKK